MQVPGPEEKYCKLPPLDQYCTLQFEVHDFPAGFAGQMVMPGSTLVPYAQCDPAGQYRSIKPMSSGVARYVPVPVPLGLVHSILYVFVAVGETVTEPDVAPFVEKSGLEQTSLFVLDHVSVVELPSTTVVGLAESDTVGTGGGAVTVIAVQGPQLSFSFVSATTLPTSAHKRAYHVPPVANVTAREMLRVLPAGVADVFTALPIHAAFAPAAEVAL